MTLKNALNYFESLVIKTSKKSSLKVYQEFIHIISGLEKKNLSESDIKLIELKLDELDLKSNSTNLKESLSQLSRYLKSSYSLIRKGYYTNLGIGLGSSFGILFGIVFLSSFERTIGLVIGLVAGMLIGLLIGHYMDLKSESAGNVI